jgi:phenylpyruvate tautomerase PptA (4-oxalocrotonate tautomerase family)
MQATSQTETRRPGKSEQQMHRLADAIARDVIKSLHYGEPAMSVATQEVITRDWAEKLCIAHIGSGG